MTVEPADDEALAALMRAHHARVRRFGGRVCRDADDADDAVQQAFIKLARRPELLKHQGALSWLLTTVRRACLRLLRSLTRWESLQEGAATAQGGDALQQLESRALLQAIERAIDMLPPEQREVLVLRDLEGLSGERTASELGLPLATMKTRLHRARRALREQLSRH